MDKEPLTQHQLWKLLNSGSVLHLGSSEIRYDPSDEGPYVVVYNGTEYRCTSIGDAAIAVVTLEGEITR